MKTEIQQLAEQLALSVRQNGLGFLTLTKEELRQKFRIGRLTERLSDEISTALHEIDFHVDPHPRGISNTVRIYDRKNLLGKLAWSVLHPEETTDGPLRQVAAILKRAEDGTNMRSEDVPWLEAFDLFLQLFHGREPEEWEDLRDDRHPTMLARELATALGLAAEVLDLAWLPKLAAAICRLRPLSRSFHAEEFVFGDRWHRAEELVRVLEGGNKRVRHERESALRVAGQLLYGGEPPTDQVELGIMGLRRRRENQL